MPCLLTHVVWIGVVMWLGRERVGVKDVVDLRAQLQERAVASTTPGSLDQLGGQLRRRVQALGREKANFCERGVGGAEASATGGWGKGSMAGVCTSVFVISSCRKRTRTSSTGTRLCIFTYFMSARQTMYDADRAGAILRCHTLSHKSAAA